ncbi:hypothetical protein EDD16DRAFT_1525811 [Pisolithus croceorrhizus]|nr:hypothetical protein EDD16DRAFT_1525811 [Pisolithus croceorrhizus]
MGLCFGMVSLLFFGLTFDSDLDFSLENAQVPESANPQLHHANITQESIPSCRSSPVCLVDIALTSVLWGSPLTPSSVIQRSDLQKPRLRVRSQLTNLQRCLEEEVLAPASFSSMELQLSALVIAFAILNPWWWFGISQASCLLQEW